MLFVTFSSNSSFRGLVLGGNIAVATDVFATRNSSAVNRSDTAFQWPVTRAHCCKLLQMDSMSINVCDNCHGLQTNCDKLNSKLQALRLIIKALLLIMT